MVEKIYLLAFLILWFFIVFVFPTVRIKQKTGINPYVFKKSDSAHDYLGRVSLPITSMIFIVVIIQLVFPEGLEYLAPFSWLKILAVKYIGYALMHLALVWIVIAQIQMSASWRIGIDDSVKTELKRSGLFSMSRNPVFLGMLTTLLGLFLVIPNALTLVVLVSSFLLFQVQVRLEEEFLFKTHGSAYVEYCKQTRRWI